jgi:hypothetical protein
LASSVVVSPQFCVVIIDVVTVTVGHDGGGSKGVVRAGRASSVPVGYAGDDVVGIVSSLSDVQTDR